MSARLEIRWAVLRIFALDLENLNTFPDHSASPCREVPFQSCLEGRMNEQRYNTYIFLLDWKHFQTNIKGYCVSSSKRRWADSLMLDTDHHVIWAKEVLQNETHPINTNLKKPQTSEPCLICRTSISQYEQQQRVYPHSSLLLWSAENVSPGASLSRVSMKTSIWSKVAALPGWPIASLTELIRSRQFHTLLSIPV